MSKDEKATINHCHYLGGLPGDKGGYGGNLIITNECIGMGIINPKKASIQWSDVSQVSYESGTAAKSRAGKVAMFGVLGLAAKSTQSQTHITFFLKDGNIAIYQVDGKSGPAVRSKINPFAMAAGVTCADDVAIGLTAQVADSPIQVASVADELKKLGELRDAGLMTAEEFDSQKAKLLN